MNIALLLVALYYPPSEAVCRANSDAGYAQTQAFPNEPVRWRDEQQRRAETWERAEWIQSPFITWRDRVNIGVEILERSLQSRVIGLPWPVVGKTT